MATAPELLKASPEAVIRPMRATDVAEVVDIERSSYQFPWSEGIFRDCLRVGYVCRVVTLSRQLLGYGVMSVGAGEAHILNLCVGQAFGRRRHGSRVSRGTALQHRRDPSVPVDGLRAGRQPPRLLSGGQRSRGCRRAQACFARLARPLALSSRSV